MRTFTITATLIFLVSVMISGCASNDVATGDNASASNTIVCEVFYRPTSGTSLEAAPEITFPGRNDQKFQEFEDMSFEARFQDDQFEGRALMIVVTNLNTGTEISRQLYQFDSQNPLKNQFVGGHGFTGLNYVFHPDSSAEMQYFCSVK